MTLPQPPACTLSDMSYLLRVVIPDQPGSLGAVATALGRAGIDIVSLDVVERGPDGAVDDLLIQLPVRGLPDTAISVAESVPGVVVESVRPYQMGGRGAQTDLELVDELAAAPAEAVRLLADLVPAVFRAGWALVLEQVGPADVRVRAASVGAPDLGGDDVALRERVSVAPPWLPLPAAVALAPDPAWAPPRWDDLGMELAAAPLGGPYTALLVGRPGGPRFRASELDRLAHLAGLAGTIARGGDRITGPY